MGKRVHLLVPGQRFGRLVLLDVAGPKRFWRCRCDCGNECIAEACKLACGEKRSCGCYRATVIGDATRTHGMAGSATYIIWQGMIKRCHVPTTKYFEHYGGRGIAVCDRWRNDFAAFFADMGECPTGYSIERVDNDGHYEPENCEWIPRGKQAANTRKKQQIKQATPLIVDMRRRGCVQKEIAVATGLSVYTVSRVLREQANANGGAF